LSHWAHFTVLRFIFVYVCKCMYFLYDCILHECVVIVTRWGRPGGIEAYPWDHYFLQCFDTVGWVIWPV